MALDLLNNHDPTDGPKGELGRFMLGRVGRLVLLLVAVAAFTFMLMQASPIDPVDAYVGADLMHVGPEQRAQIADKWGLDDPPLERFGSWLSNIVRGELGRSAVFNQPVVDVIASRFLTSLALMAVAWVLSGVIGFALGLLAGSRRGSMLDRGIRWWAYTLASAPTFWVGLLLLSIFAVALNWAPTCCAAPIGSLPGEVGLLDRLHHLILPAITLSIIGVAPVILHTRQAVIEAMESDYVAYARAQGENTTGLIWHRVLRNAAAPAVLLQFASLGELFGGSVLAETVFAYPGLGSATATAAMRQDVPLLLGITLFTALFVYLGNLVGDLVHHRIDPRTPLRNIDTGAHR